jgi:hypothetical protein
MDLNSKKEKFVGLTNSPQEIKKIYNNPQDWFQRQFVSKQQALKWKLKLTDDFKYQEIGGNEDWKYGFTFTPQEQYITLKKENI